MALLGMLCFCCYCCPDLSYRDLAGLLNDVRGSWCLTLLAHCARISARQAKQAKLPSGKGWVARKPISSLRDDPVCSNISGRYLNCADLSPCGTPPREPLQNPSALTIATVYIQQFHLHLTLMGKIWKFLENFSMDPTHHILLRCASSCIKCMCLKQVFQTRSIAEKYWGWNLVDYFAPPYWSHRWSSINLLHRSTQH